MKKTDKLVALCILLIAIFVSIKLDQSSESRSDWKKISPFTDLKFEGEKIITEFEDTFYELASIEKISSAELIKVSKKEFGMKWQKRIREDIAEVLMEAGAPESTRVELELKELETGAVKTVQDAEMTHENRQKYYNPS